jgi:hypothetical protein
MEYIKKECTRGKKIQNSIDPIFNLLSFFSLEDA